MKKLGVLFLTISLLCMMLVSGQANGVVRVYNWEDYISPESLELFEEETGIKVDYMRFTTNEDMMVQVRNIPRRI